MCTPRNVCADSRQQAPRPPGPVERAFTLIELLVVIAIISLLVTMITPSLTRAKELARRTQCACNLHSICEDLEMYSQSNYNAFPYVPLNGAGWGVAIGTGRTVNPFTGASQARNPTANFWMLVREGSNAGLFVCPSSGDRPDGSYAKNYYDFTDGTNVSFAMNNPYGPNRYFHATQERPIILADGSPYFDPKTGLRNDVEPAPLASAKTTADAQKGNSRSHNGEGQNVAVADGSAWFEKHADVGINRDNIYTRAVAAEGVDRNGNLPTAAGSGDGADQGPAGLLDSYLVP
jgi:prepilin-type N-terminal cleavage/methylation domain-containing protein